MLYLPRLLLSPPRDTHGVCGFGTSDSTSDEQHIAEKEVQRNSLAELIVCPSAGATDEERLNGDLELMMVHRSRDGGGRHKLASIVYTC